jgi:hypothetical protein
MDVSQRYRAGYGDFHVSSGSFHVGQLDEVWMAFSMLAEFMVSGDGRRHCRNKF